MSEETQPKEEERIEASYRLGHGNYESEPLLTRENFLDTSNKGNTRAPISSRYIMYERSKSEAE